MKKEEILQLLENYLEDINLEDDGMNFETAVEEILFHHNLLKGSGLYENEDLSSDECYDRAMESDDLPEKMEYLNRAVRLDPMNLEARAEKIHLESEDSLSELEELGKLAQFAEEMLKKNHIVEDDDEGSYYGIPETRPYIRLRFRRLRLYLDCGMMNKAEKEAMDILRLNEMDNLGVRFTLGCIYAFQENREKLEKLDEIYAKHGYCLNTLYSFEFEGSAGFEKMNNIMASLRSGITSVAGKNVKTLNDYSKGIDGLPKSDVLKFFLEGNCSVVVRPSGTEPKLKLYISVSEKDKEKAGEVEAKIAEEFKAKIK